MFNVKVYFVSCTTLYMNYLIINYLYVYIISQYARIWILNFIHSRTPPRHKFSYRNRITIEYNSPIRLLISCSSYSLISIIADVKLNNRDTIQYVLHARYVSLNQYYVSSDINSYVESMQFGGLVLNTGDVCLGFIQ